MKQVICDMCKTPIPPNTPEIGLSINQTIDDDTQFTCIYDLCKECLDKFDQFLYSNSMKSEL